MSPDEAIEKAARVLADKRRKGCYVCMGYPPDPQPAAKHPLKPNPKADVPDHHIAAHVKLARGDVRTVAPILWAARNDGSEGAP